MSSARNVRLLGWFHVVISGVLLLAGIVVCIGLATGSDKDSQAAAVIIPSFGWIALICLVPSLVGGAGLIAMKPWGRVVIIVLSALYLFGIPIGTIVGGLGLWILLGRDANALFAGGSRTATAGGPDTAAVEFHSGGGSGLAVPPGDKLVLLLTIAGVGAGFIVVLGAGFMWTGDPAPYEITVAFYPALIVLAIAVGYGIYRFATQPTWPSLSGYMLPWTPWERSQAEAARKAREELLQRRLAHLAADPLRRKYVALIKGGEHWTDEQIDYDIDPAWTVTCPHLRPIEKAMRAARLPMRRGTGAQVDAACVVDEDRLKRDFTASGPAGYHEFEYYDHSPVADRRAHIACSACTSAIEVVHPQRAAPGTPVFPA